MNKKYELNGFNYEIVENYKDGFDYETLKEKATDYFNDYDYILGDWSYGKLRLKGFCDKENNHFRDINSIDNYKTYVKTECAYDCSWFLIKKIKD